jgi:hypothetical protein
MSGKCSSYGGKRVVLPVFWWAIMKKRDHWEGQGVAGMTKLEESFRNWDGEGRRLD